MPRLSHLAFACAALFCSPLIASETLYNQIALRAEVSQEVPHDLMHVTLYTEAQNSDPAALANSITQSLNQSLEKARKAKNVSVKLGSRQSYPVYADDGERISAWRERAEIRLDSADFSTLSSLTGELLQNLKMAGMSFSIAAPTRRASEDALIKEAINAFRARAQLASEALGGQRYKIINLNLSSQGFHAPVPMMAYARKDMAMREAVNPQIEAGESLVSVSADGLIEVLLPD